LKKKQKKKLNVVLKDYSLYAIWEEKLLYILKRGADYYFLGGGLILIVL
jgi:hypothetical protein